MYAPNRKTSLGDLTRYRLENGAAAPASGRTTPQRRLPQNGQATCNQSGGLRRTAGISPQTTSSQLPAAITKRIRSSTAQVSIHPIGKALLADQLTCYLCRRSILLPMYPVRTAPTSPRKRGEVISDPTKGHQAQACCPVPSFSKHATRCCPPMSAASVRSCSAPSHRAAGVEGAARWRIDRARHVAFDQRLQASCVWDRDRHRGQQRLRIGMPRVGEKLALLGDLDDPAEIHHRDAVADMRDDREIVRDEQIGKAVLVAAGPSGG